jgi:hypothetical protein
MLIQSSLLRWRRCGTIYARNLLCREGYTHSAVAVHIPLSHLRGSASARLKAGLARPAQYDTAAAAAAAAVNPPHLHVHRSGRTSRPSTSFHGRVQRAQRLQQLPTLPQRQQAALKANRNAADLVYPSIHQSNAPSSCRRSSAATCVTSSHAATE